MNEDDDMVNDDDVVNNEEVVHEETVVHEEEDIHTEETGSNNGEMDDAADGVGPLNNADNRT